ncbi:MAG: hypothetical protein KKH22_04645 [Proteobacteria bacterium]|nr:hypothetical protein [Pseudomonadota bacterium]
MPIVQNQLIPANAGLPGYAVAKELARQQVAHFGAVRGAGAGVGPGSCCAAVAVIPNPGLGFAAAPAVAGFGAVPPGGVVPPAVAGAPLPYSVVYGNSQMAAGGLVLGPVAGHAERAALTNTQAAGLGLGCLHMVAPNQAVLFVELAPCGGCAGWLNGVAGAGVANPFNGIINGAGVVTLNVWYRWSYPGPPALPAIAGVAPALAVPGGAAMNAFHALLLPAELADINGASW